MKTRRSVRRKSNTRRSRGGGFLNSLFGSKPVAQVVAPNVLNVVKLNTDLDYLSKMIKAFNGKDMAAQARINAGITSTSNYCTLQAGRNASEKLTPTKCLECNYTLKRINNLAKQIIATLGEKRPELSSYLTDLIVSSTSPLKSTNVPCALFNNLPTLPEEFITA